MSAEKIKKLKAEIAEIREDFDVLEGDEKKMAEEMIAENEAEIAELEKASKKTPTEKPKAKPKSKGSSQEIKDMEALINSGILSGEDLEDAKKKLAEMKAKGEKKPAKKEPAKKKTESKSSTTKKDDKGEYELIDGEKVYYSDKDYCDKVINAWKKRKRKATKSAKKYKTKPVMATISDNVGRAIKKAVTNVPAKDIKAKPKEHIKKFEELEKKAKEFLQAFKSVLGQDFKESEINDELKEFEELINKLKAKYMPKEKK